MDGACGEVRKLRRRVTLAARGGNAEAMTEVIEY